MRPEIASHIERDIETVLAVCAGAYSTRTLKGYQADLRIFTAWCAGHSATWLPALPATVAQFVDDQVQRHRIATIKRRLCAIAFAHRLRDLEPPTGATAVRLAVRRAERARPSRPQQKQGLTHTIRRLLVEACPETLAGLRDAALISVGYDTLCRSSELAAMQVGHVDLEGDACGRVLIPRTKADATGEGRVAHLSPETTLYLRRWLSAAQLTSGFLFRSLHLARAGEGPMCTVSIRRLIKRATRRAGYDAAVTANLSGHSMRIGAAQDMLVSGFDAVAIMQAGGWKSAHVVLRYVENAATREIHERRWKRLREAL